MTNEERVKKFKSHDLVVNCQTEEEAKEFLKWCYDNGIKWECDDINTTHWHNCETCYRCFVDGVLSWSELSSYNKSRFLIVTYQDFFKQEKEQTRLEHIIDNFDSFSSSTNVSHDELIICEIAYKMENNYMCDGQCEKCKFNKMIDVLKYLNEKHIDKIKLSQFEYDLINLYVGNAKDINRNQKLKDYKTIVGMQKIGYFKGLDLNITLKDFKEYCEVIER